MLNVICFKWNTPGYRSKFTAEHVNVLQSMVKRNLDIDHRFICITDDTKDVKCDIIPLWDFPHIKHFKSRTNAFRCLKLFDPTLEHLFDSDRILVLDLDLIIVDNITNLVNVSDDFKIWKDPHPKTHYNSSIWTYKLGTRSQVWETFDPINSPLTIKKQGIIGSDQAWMSYSLGPNEATWSNKDGIYSYKVDLDRGRSTLPDNAKVVVFHGQFDPWMPEVQKKSPWIKDHYK